MEGAGRRALVQGTAVAALALAALFFALRPLSIAFPEADLDGSWMVVLGEGAARSARWGVDLAFTYGPASALITRYGTSSYLTAVVPLAVAVSVVYGLCYGRLLVLAGRPLWQAMAAILVVLAGTAASRLDQDSFFYALACLLYLLDLRRLRRDGASAVVVASGAVVMGAVALSKTGFAITAGVLFLLSDVRSAIWLRRLPVLTVPYLAAFLVTYATYDQHLADLPAFARLQWSVASGYGEAMYLLGSRGEVWGFLAGASALVVVVALGGLGAWRALTERIFPVFGVVLVLVIGFKAGFVRQDTHPQIAWLLLGLLGLAVSVALVLPRSGSGAAALMGCSLAVLWIVAPLLLLVENDTPIDGAGVAGLAQDYVNEYAAEMDELGRFVRSPSGFAAAMAARKASAWAAIRAKYPLPPLAGAIDILPSAQTSILANGLDYRPRPSFQDYSTYTQTLIDANAAFLANSPPDWMLFAPGALDDRFPNTTEGALWPDLLRRYEPVQRVGDMLALHRRPQPLPEVLGPAQRLSARIGQSFAVPAGPVFARIVVRKTLLGSLAAALFRPPALSMLVKMEDGSVNTYRFIPALGAGGFLLSPLIDASDGFAELGTGGADDLEGKAVSEVLVGGSSVSHLFYEPGIDVEFRPVTVAAAQPSAEGRALFDDLSRGRPWRLLVRQLGQLKNLDGSHLSVPAPTALTVPTEGRRHLHVGFGIEDGAWAPGETHGVCFVVAPVMATDALGPSAPLWQRCLDPHAVAADRGTQSADVDLPAGVTAVTAATTCPESCDWGWSYWSDIDPET